MATTQRPQLAGLTPDGETARQRRSRDAHLSVLLAANRFGAELDAVLAEHHLSMAQFVALWVLALSDDTDGMTQGALADGLLNRASDVSRLVDRLMKADLVERIASTTDGRVALVRITGAGTAVMSKAFAAVTACTEREWSGLSMTELGELNRLLGKALWGNA